MNEISAPPTTSSQVLQNENASNSEDLENPWINVTKQAVGKGAKNNGRKKTVNNNNNYSKKRIAKSASKKTKTIEDLEVVDDGEASDSSIEDGFTPKSHLSWASFGETIKAAEKKMTPRKRMYVVRSQNQQKATPFVKNLLKRNQKEVPVKVQEQRPPMDESVEDEEVDVVGGIDDEEPITSLEAQNEEEEDRDSPPPDLPPQRPQSSRYEMMRLKKEITLNRERMGDGESVCKRSRFSSPPPYLERQTENDEGSADSCQKSDNSDDDDEEEEKVLEQPPVAYNRPPVAYDTSNKSFDHILQHDPNQLLKTKISSSSIPILPMSKSIMERKKAAVEMTKNASIRRMPINKAHGSKNVSVAPKSVQMPAFSERSPVTLYSNFNKPAPYSTSKPPKNGGDFDNPHFTIDMSNFKFSDDSNTISVRAHLCDQTRVMIARVAFWNREYAKRLGNRAGGTAWQKPDEVTAQMTGFCSATVRRCIEIANYSMVPKCADRVGVSNNELQFLQNAFSEDTTFYGQPMRNPHVLSNYYQMKNPTPHLLPASPEDKPGFEEKIEPENVFARRISEAVHKKDSERDKRTDPFSLIGRPLPTSQPPPLPAAKKNILRWSAITTNRVVTPPPRTFVRVAARQLTSTPTASTSAPSAASFEQFKRNLNVEMGRVPIPQVVRFRRADSTAKEKKRGRPKKCREDDEEFYATARKHDPIVRPVRITRRASKLSQQSEQNVQVITDLVKQMIDSIADEIDNS